MIPPPVDPSATPAWARLVEDAARLSASSIAELFANDPARLEVMSIDVGGIHADLSKNLIDRAALNHLLELAAETGVTELRDAMMAGELVNTTEGRPALHTALRDPGGRGEPAAMEAARSAAEVLASMGAFCDEVRSGLRTGSTGQRFRSIVSIGIGGSFLGPQLAAAALRRHGHPDLEARFVANVDGAELEAALAGLDPATTLIVVCSKTFTTSETMANARLARNWLTETLGARSIAVHMAAVSTASDLVASFGIDPAMTFGFWDFVGGRFSMDSAVGLSTMLLIGPEAFGEMLAGFHDMDVHFSTAPPERNLPLLMGLLRVWYSALLEAESVAVIPYAADLSRLPAYLQQLEMESNGKSVRRDGTPVSGTTAPIVWGEPGTDAQHSFLQLLHQGTHLIPVDLIGALAPLSTFVESHDLLMANLFAQAEALAFGRSTEELVASGLPKDDAPHRALPGNRPSTLVLLDQLDPRTFGSLIALYEHVTVTAGAVFGIDSFDQWGVELGKELASGIVAEITGDVSEAHDPSTKAAIERYRAARS